MTTFSECCIAVNLGRMEYDRDKGRALVDKFGGFANSVLANVFDGPGSQSHHLFVISRTSRDAFRNFVHSSTEFQNPVIVEFDEISSTSKLR